MTQPMAVAMTRIRSTHTYAELEVSQATYDEIAAKLRGAGYEHAFIDGVRIEPTIDMHGIGLVVATTAGVKDE